MTLCLLLLLVHVASPANDPEAELVSNLEHMVGVSCETATACEESAASQLRTQQFFGAIPNYARAIQLQPRRAAGTPPDAGIGGEHPSQTSATAALCRCHNNLAVAFALQRYDDFAKKHLHQAVAEAALLAPYPRLRLACARSRPPAISRASRKRCADGRWLTVGVDRTSELSALVAMADEALRGHGARGVAAGLAMQLYERRYRMVGAVVMPAADGNWPSPASAASFS